MATEPENVEQEKQPEAGAIDLMQALVETNKPVPDESESVSVTLGESDITVNPSAAETIQKAFSDQEKKYRSMQSSHDQKDAALRQAQIQIQQLQQPAVPGQAQQPLQQPAQRQVAQPSVAPPATAPDLAFLNDELSPELAGKLGDVIAGQVQTQNQAGQNQYTALAQQIQQLQEGQAQQLSAMAPMIEQQQKETQRQIVLSRVNQINTDRSVDIDAEAVASRFEESMYINPQANGEEVYQNIIFDAFAGQNGTQQDVQKQDTPRFGVTVNAAVPAKGRVEANKSNLKMNLTGIKNANVID